MNTIKYMKKQGISTYGTPEKKKNIRISKEGVKINIPTGKAKKIGVTVWEGVKRTGRGLKIMSEGVNKTSKSKTGKKIRGGFENAYNNFYGK